MLVTDKFVFVHMHKCGGTFINMFIKTFFPSAKEIGYHYPIGLLPPQYRHLPVLGTVRNPWEFYVSYYVFQQTVLRRARAAMPAAATREGASADAGDVDPLNGVDALFSCLSDDGALDFAATINRFLDLSISDTLLQGALARMPTRYGQRGPDTPTQQSGFRGMDLLRDELADISGSGLGFYTFLFRRIMGEDDVYVVPTTRLRTGLLEFLRRASVPITSEMEQYAMEHRPENRSEHAHSATYYSDGLKQRVADQDSLLIRRHGFQFEPAPRNAGC